MGELIGERTQNTFNDGKLRTKPKSQHHDEEEDGPQRGDGHLGQGFWVDNESQSWTCKHNMAKKWKILRLKVPVNNDCTSPKN